MVRDDTEHLVTAFSSFRVLGLDEPSIVTMTAGENSVFFLLLELDRLRYATTVNSST